MLTVLRCLSILNTKQFNLSIFVFGVNGSPVGTTPTGVRVKVHDKIGKGYRQTGTGNEPNKSDYL